MAGARPIVNPPEVMPVPFGLWDAVIPLSPVPDHWQQGISWIERCPTGAATYDECLAVTGTGGPVPVQSPKTDNVLQTFRGATPFTVYAEFDCSPVGSVPEIEDAATKALARVEDFQASRAFWTGTVQGTVQTFPHLSAETEVFDDQGMLLQPEALVCTPRTDIGTPTPVDIAEGLGLLEACLMDCYNGVGAIHIPPGLLPTMVAWNLLEKSDHELFTFLGNRVVVGHGYPQPTTAPSGNPSEPSQTWMYATGQVFGMRSPNVFATRLPESFDRAENTVKMLAERTYVLAFECCLFAALVNLGVPES